MRHLALMPYLKRLDIPVPPAPILENAVGYLVKEPPRWLALWWERCGDEVMYSDGRLMSTGDWHGYLTWVDSCASVLRGYELGDSETAALHCLVIDLVDRVAYVTDLCTGRLFVSRQWPIPTDERGKPLRLTHQQYVDLARETRAALIQSVRDTCTTIADQMRAQRQAVDDLINWLQSS